MLFYGQEEYTWACASGSEARAVAGGGAPSGAGGGQLQAVGVKPEAGGVIDVDAPGGLAATHVKAAAAAAAPVKLEAAGAL